MTSVFLVKHDSFHGKETRYPWATKILRSMDRVDECDQCGGANTSPRGDLTVQLEPHQGREWPDILGCGAYPLLIVSDTALKLWCTLGLKPPKWKVFIDGPMPGLPPPDRRTYWWVDGASMLGAKVDFDKSGYVGVRFCRKCGRREDDVAATYERQRERVWPTVFVRESWNGAQLFTTDISPTRFFCTQVIADASKDAKLTNFRFEEVGKIG